MNLDSLKLQIEEFIRTGRRDQAASLLATLKGTSLPRSQISDFANLARRAGQLNLALQLMAPIVRPKFPLKVPALPDEKATYAIILLGVGAISEAFEILESCETKTANVDLALAYTYINSWDYLSAIPRLRAYLKYDTVSPYQKMIAKVNLAASYVAASKHEEGHALLQQILEETLKNEWHLLRKNSLEISAQLAIQQQRWDEAAGFLNHAVHSGGKGFNMDDFFVAKWKAIADLSKEGANEKTLSAIDKIRASAVEYKHWETIRDCDYYKSISTRDSDLAHQLYFGTPHASFRKRLVQKGAEWLKIPNEFHWKIGQDATRVFDLGRAEEVGTSVSMKAGTSLHRGLIALTSDFYRPFSVGSLHSLVFPKEHFNPYSSPRRISFLIHRLRAWFEEHNVPLRIIAAKSEFRLQATGSYAFVLEKRPVLKIARDTDSDTPANFLTILRKLKDAKREKPFSTAEIAKITDLSVRSVRYFLKWATEKNKIRKFGTGRDTRYKAR